MGAYSDVLATLAVAISGVALLQSRRAIAAGEAQADAARTQTRQQTERLREERAARLHAHVSAAIVGADLVLTNAGPADATDVRVVVHPLEKPGVAEHVFSSVQPVGHLAAGAPNAQRLRVYDGAPIRYRVTLTWAHPATTPGTRTQDLDR